MAFIALLAVMLSWMVWRSLVTGRLTEIGPERRLAPVSFWLGLFFLASFALSQVVVVALYLWTVGMAAYLDA